MPLPWFRRKQQQSAATIATPFTELAPEELPLGEKEAPAPSDSTVAAGPESGDQAAKPKRRRGSRGGTESPQARERGGRRGRGDAGAEATGSGEGREGSGEGREDPRDGKSATDRRRSSNSSNRRRQPPRRAPLPAAKRELLVSVDVSEQRVAVLEDGRVAEVYLERPERRSIAGNIYKGVVDNVLPGDGGRVRRDRPREERLPVRRRDRRARARGPPAARPADHRTCSAAARRSSSRRSRTR